MERRVTGEPILGPQLEPFDGPLDKARYITAAEHYPLGRPGGAGGVQDCGGLVWFDMRSRLCRGVTKPLVPAVAAAAGVDYRDRSIHRTFGQQPVMHRWSRQQQTDFRIRNDRANV